MLGRLKKIIMGAVAMRKSIALIEQRLVKSRLRRLLRRKIWLMNLREWVKIFEILPIKNLLHMHDLLVHDCIIINISLLATWIRNLA